MLTQVLGRILQVRYAKSAYRLNDIRSDSSKWRVHPRFTFLKNKKLRHDFAKTRIVIGRVVTGFWHRCRSTAYNSSGSATALPRGSDGVFPVKTTFMWRKQTLPVTEDHAILFKRKRPAFSNIAVGLQTLCRQFLLRDARTWRSKILLCRRNKRNQQTATKQQGLGKAGINIPQSGKASTSPNRLRHRNGHRKHLKTLSTIQKSIKNSKPIVSHPLGKGNNPKAQTAKNIRVCT